MKKLWPLFKRELAGYFATPLAYVFIVIFLVLTGVFTFYLGGFFQRGQADLQAFFLWHPWLFLLLVPALGMRLWAEERKTGTIELLLTLPVSMTEAVLAKFLAAWAMIAISLALTFPIWISVNLLGDPDNGVIVANYLGSLLMAGAYLAVAACLSATTRNQVIAFVISTLACFAFLLAGFPLVLDFFRPWLPQAALDAIASLSFLSHFETITRGMIDLRDLLFFVSFILLWLYLGAWVISRKKASGGYRTRSGSGLFSRSGLLGALLLFLLLNVAVSPLLRGLRLDLTEQRLNTLSSGTRHILAGIDKPLTLKFFLSREQIKQVPGLESFAERVATLLDEYANLADGRLTIEQIDPEPFSEAEDEAVQFGLRGVQITAGGDSIYFGLVGELDGRRKVIPFFQPERERFLEYDLSQLLYQLAHPKKLVVGLLSGAPIDGGFTPGPNPRMRRPWLILDQLRRQFEIRTLPRTAEPITDDVDLLMLVHPAGLDAGTLYAVDQYLLRGGRALVFADPLSEAAAEGNPAGAISSNPDFERMLASWGVEMEPGKVVGDLPQSHKVNYQGRLRTMQINYLPWLNIGRDSLADDDVITSRLGNLNLATAGALRPLKGAKTTFSPLIKSSDQAMLIDAAKIAFAPNPARLLADFKPAGKPFVLAARIDGEIVSAFPDGRPKAGEKQESADKEKKTAAEHLATSKGPVHLVVIADSDLLQDRFWVQATNVFGGSLAIPISANADLAANAIESLGGSPDLISVRSRGSYQRPFTLVAELQRKAEMRFRAKEQELTNKLRETETKLNELQRGRDDSGATTLTAEQQRELDRFLAEKVKFRKQLRAVQYQLRAEIDNLEAMLKVFNILFVPGLIALIAFVAWVIRRARGREY